MFHDYDKFNYWKIEIEELPSRGRLYPGNASIKIRPLSVLEVKFLATLLPQTATQVCNELLEKCTILENFTYEDLLLPDRLYLIFWIRLNSFSMKTGYTVNIPHCSVCGNKIEHEIKLEELKFKYLDNDFDPYVYLPDYDETVKISIPKYKDSIIRTEDDLDELALYLDNGIGSFEDKRKYMEEMSAMDYITFKEAVERNSCGVITDIVVSCPQCHKAYPVKIEINDNNLFSPVNIMEILETITKICKYSNLQITNEWSWIEVEIENEIIKKMIKEENEYNKKEMDKAKSQASSMPHMSGVPSVPHFR